MICAAERLQGLLSRCLGEEAEVARYVLNGSHSGGYFAFDRYRQVLSLVRIP